MGIFSKKEDCKYIITSKYFIIGDDLYRFEVRDFMPASDCNLPTTELLNKYGFYVSRYELKFTLTSEHASYYKTLDDVHYDMTNAKELSEKEFEYAVSNLKSTFKKKFDDFRLDGSLYSANFCMRDESQCFPTIVKPKRKLIYERYNDVTSSLILEVEVLDGRTAQIGNAFITFYDFLKTYSLGHDIKVLVDDEASNVKKIEDYFDFT